MQPSAPSYLQSPANGKKKRGELMHPGLGGDLNLGCHQVCYPLQILGSLLFHYFKIVQSGLCSLVGFSNTCKRYQSTSCYANIKNTILQIQKKYCAILRTTYSTQSYFQVRRSFVNKNWCLAQTYFKLKVNSWDQQRKSRTVLRNLYVTMGLSF